MNWILKLIGKYTGVSAIWKYIDGAKLYIVAGVGVLTGVCGLAQDYLTISQAHNLGTLWTFIQGFPKNENWLMIMGSLAGFAAAHKGNKIIDAIAPVVPEDKILTNGMPSGEMPKLCDVKLPDEPLKP